MKQKWSQHQKRKTADKEAKIEMNKLMNKKQKKKNRVCPQHKRVTSMSRGEKQRKEARFNTRNEVKKWKSVEDREREPMATKSQNNHNCHNLLNKLNI